MRGKRIQCHAMQPVGTRPRSKTCLSGLDTGVLRGDLTELRQRLAEAAPMCAALATKINGLAPRCGQLRVKGKQFGKPVNDAAEEQPGPGMAGAAAVCRSPSLEKPCPFEPCGMGAQPCL